jgi:hypothetical protein
VAAIDPIAAPGGSCRGLALPAGQEVPGDDDALDLVGALVNLGDRGPWGSFRR